MAHFGCDHARTTVTLRPRRIRRVCWVLAPLVVAFFVVLGLLLSGATGDGAGRVPAQRPDRDDGPRRVRGRRHPAVHPAQGRRRRGPTSRITNVIGGYDLPWEVVRTVRFERGNPWASLELDNDDVVAVMAIQAADKEHAVAGVT